MHQDQNLCEGKVLLDELGEIHLFHFLYLAVEHNEGSIGFLVDVNIGQRCLFGLQKVNSRIWALRSY